MTGRLFTGRFNLCRLKISEPRRAQKKEQKKKKSDTDDRRLVVQPCVRSTVCCLRSLSCAAAAKRAES